MGQPIMNDKLIHPCAYIENFSFTASTFQRIVFQRTSIRDFFRFNTFFSSFRQILCNKLEKESFRIYYKTQLDIPDNITLMAYNSLYSNSIYLKDTYEF